MFNWEMFQFYAQNELISNLMPATRSGGKSHMFKSQASLKSLPSSLKQVSSHSTNKSSKSSQVSGSPQASQVESW